MNDAIRIEPYTDSTRGAHICSNSFGGKRCDFCFELVKVDTMNVKPSNPKDALGVTKHPFSTMSQTVSAEVGVAMLEGALKYGRHNYRVIGVKGSIYFDAALRHLTRWWEGQNLDPDSGLSHVTKAIASLYVLRDAMIQGKFNDDRPPPAPEGFFRELDEHVRSLNGNFENPCLPYTNIKDGSSHVEDKYESGSTIQSSGGTTCTGKATQSTDHTTRI